MAGAKRDSSRPRQTKAVIAVFLLTVFICLFLNAGAIRLWWAFMDYAPDKMTVNGVARSYMLTLPQQKGPVPLVIMLHGMTETARIMERRFGFDDVAKAEGFAIAYPNGIDRAWTVVPPGTNDPRGKSAQADMDFIDTLADDLVKRGIADPKRIYLAGSSNGGQFVFLMACVRPNRFAAMGSVIATMTGAVRKQCKAPPVMPMFLLNSTSDPRVPWDGAPDADPVVSYLSVADTVSFWARADRCAGQKTTASFPRLHPEETTSVSSRTFAPCAKSSKVAFYAVDKGGHQPPSISGDDGWSSFLGPRNHDIETAAEMWKFFSQFSR
jgi:polyhydroxybutyrate depolymerase